jgi:hypothetical protein
VPIGLSDEYQGKVDDVMRFHDGSQEVPPNQQSNDEIPGCDSAIALDDYPFLWSDADLVSTQNCRSGEERDLKGSHVGINSRILKVNPHDVTGR